MSPKERFQANKQFVSGYNDLMDSATMQAAFDAAMLEFIGRFEISQYPEHATSKAYQLEGAQRFLNVLKNLNTQVSERNSSKGAVLRHDV